MEVDGSKSIPLFVTWLIIQRDVKRKLCYLKKDNGHKEDEGLEEILKSQKKEKREGACQNTYLKLRRYSGIALVHCSRSCQRRCFGALNNGLG